MSHLLLLTLQEDEDDMSEGEIPINTGDLPIDAITLDESNVYNGYLKRATVSPKPNKSGAVYCAIQLEVADGDYEGMIVMMNHLPLPVPITPDMRKSERIKAHNQAVSFGRFVRAFGINDALHYVSLSDPESIREWHEWIEKFHGNSGKFTVKNQEFPEGSGRLRSGVSDFVF